MVRQFIGKWIAVSLRTVQQLQIITSSGVETSLCNHNISSQSLLFHVKTLSLNKWQTRWNWRDLHLNDLCCVVLAQGIKTRCFCCLVLVYTSSKCTNYNKHLILHQIRTEGMFNMPHTSSYETVGSKECESPVLSTKTHHWKYLFLHIYLSTRRLKTSQL
jgi:hypothetical protein